MDTRSLYVSCIIVKFEEEDDDMKRTNNVALRIAYCLGLRSSSELRPTIYCCRLEAWASHLQIFARVEGQERKRGHIR